MSIADTLVFALSGDGFSTEWVRLGQEAVERVHAAASTSSFSMSAYPT